jgi:hypothetical protein
MDTKKHLRIIKEIQNVFDINELDFCEIVEVLSAYN